MTQQEGNKPMAVYINRSQAIAERLVKLRDYLYANASPTHAVKIGDMLTYLANEGYEVEIKTVYSDLKTLEVHFGLDLHYDGRQRGYLLNNPPFAPYELREIVNSVQAAKFITQKEADRLTAKIMRLADNYTRPLLNRKTFVRNRVRNSNEEAMRGLDTIYEAMAQDRKISYKYFHYSRDMQRTKRYADIDGSKIIIASPYGVSWNGEHFTILATRVTSKCTRAYMLQLDNMEQVKILEEKREGKARIQHMLDDGFQNVDHPARALCQTKLKVPNSCFEDIIEKFGLDVTIIPLDEKFFAVTVDHSPTPEFYLWTLKFHPRIEILAPEDAETKLKAYFADVSKGIDTLRPYV